MAELPLRLRILIAITDALAGITIANGYKLDIGPDRVFRGRVIFGDNDPLPMLSVLEVPIQPDQIGSPGDSTDNAGTWDLMVQGFAQDDPVNPTDPAHILMAEAKRALIVEKAKVRDFNILGMGGKVVEMRIGAGVVRPPDEVSAVAYFWLALNLDLAEDLLDPYED